MRTHQVVSDVRGARARLVLAVFVSGLAGLALTGHVEGQEAGALVTDRPDQTESAESVPAGFVQVELGWTFAREENAIETRDVHSVPQALLRLGLGNGVEARLGVPGYLSEKRSVVGGTEPSSDVSGAGDAEIGLKLEVRDWGGTQLAVLAGVSLPTGEDAFSSQRVDPSVRLLVAHPLSERLSLGYNVGLAWATESTGDCCLDTQLEAPYTLALGIGLTDRLSAFVEGFGAFGLSDDREAVHGLDGGFTYLVSEAFQLDINTGVALNEAAEDWFVGGGFAFRLPR